jgi:hypothetical protein
VLARLVLPVRVLLVLLVLERRVRRQLRVLVQGQGLAAQHSLQRLLRVFLL